MAIGCGGYGVPSPAPVPAKKIYTCYLPVTYSGYIFYIYTRLCEYVSKTVAAPPPTCISTHHFYPHVPIIRYFFSAYLTVMLSYAPISSIPSQSYFLQYNIFQNQKMQHIFNVLVVLKLKIKQYFNNNQYYTNTISTKN